ncbi:MAG: antibiotic biosynthesis monooxygenase [Actinomycetota bacterium]|nr:antibiotic biosynthesis monooxygenase [Actinomycetota bacterium]
MSRPTTARQGESLMEEQREPLVLINAFEVPPDKDDEFIRGWEAARDYLQSQPGYVSTALHGALSPDADFRFVNVVRWQSREAFQAAVQSSGFQAASQRPGDVPAAPGTLRGRAHLTRQDHHR